jgi:hypothetical protein
MSSESSAGASAPEMGMVSGTTRTEASPNDPAHERLVAEVAAGVAGCAVAPGA